MQDSAKSHTKLQLLKVLSPIFLVLLLLISTDLFCFSTGFDQSLLSNIQKLFSEKIEIFSAVEFSKVSILTGIIKITLKVLRTFLADNNIKMQQKLHSLPKRCNKIRRSERRPIVGCRENHACFYTMLKQRMIKNQPNGFVKNKSHYIEINSDKEGLAIEGK